MAENIKDVIRHLEKDMADILDVLNDKLTTEVILNPYRKPNGIYEGHILFEQHGKGLSNLVRETEISIIPLKINIGDLILCKYINNNPDDIIFWTKIALDSSCAEQRKNIATCIKSYFVNINEKDNVIKQSHEFRILEFAQNLEDGYITDKELSDSEIKDLDACIEILNHYLLKISGFSLKLIQIQTIDDIQLFQECPSRLIKSEIVKMTATKAETIMSVLSSITGKFIHEKTIKTNNGLLCQKDPLSVGLINTQTFLGMCRSLTPPPAPLSHLS